MQLLCYVLWGTIYTHLRRGYAGLLPSTPAPTKDRAWAQHYAWPQDPLGHIRLVSSKGTGKEVIELSPLSLSCREAEPCFHASESWATGTWQQFVSAPRPWVVKMGKAVHDGGMGTMKSSLAWFGLWIWPSSFRKGIKPWSPAIIATYRAPLPTALLSSFSINSELVLAVCN